MMPMEPGSFPDEGSGETASNVEGATESGECIIFVDPSTDVSGDGTSRGQAVGTVKEALDIAERSLKNADDCSIVTRGEMEETRDLQERVSTMDGSVEIRVDDQWDASLIKSAEEEASADETAASEERFRNGSAFGFSDAVANAGEMSAEIDYAPFAACGCDSFPGFVSMTSTRDANGSQGSGVLEIGGSLRIDGNEVITNSNTTLYLQHRNNGDLRVDDGTLFVDASSNNVGIGTTSPTSKLDVRGDLKVTGKLNGAEFEGYSNPGGNGLNIGATFVATQSRVFNVKNRDGDIYARFNSDDQSFTLNGRIKAEEIVVEADLADYVFQDGYDLKSLDEVEAFIESNDHLPGMPSERDVDSHGLSLGDFNNLLLQKIEELTLHVIAQNKRIKSLEKNVQ